jgi:putative membrane protein
MMWGWGNGMGGAGGVVGIVVMLAVLALIVVGIVLLVRGLTGRHYYSEAGRSPEAPPVGTASKGALQVLEDRYARGDIDREEFLQRKQDLLGG